VHIDSTAAESAEAVNARAYTIGQHIVFGNSEYALETSVGQKLLAHELAHVVQQTTAGVRVLARQTRRQVARDEHLRDLARRPGLALHEWRRLSEGERMAVVTYMTIYYSAEFASHFLETTRKRPRPEELIHITNLPDRTPEALTRQGYRFAGRMGNSELQIWVHPSGREVWLLPPSSPPAQQAPAEATPVAGPPENPNHIDLPANPSAVYGAVTATRADAEVLGTRGRVVRYADGTVEVYPAGSTTRYTYRPQPGGFNAYDFYDEKGDRTTLIAIDLDEVFGAGGGPGP
jgi:hypothetical protein